MKDGKQYFLIIENKKKDNLRKNQFKTCIYYLTLVNILTNYNNDKDSNDDKVNAMFNKFGIQNNINNIQSKVYSVLIKTGLTKKEVPITTNDIKISLKELDDVCQEYITSHENDFWNNHIKLINTDKDLEKLAKVLENNKHIDSLINDYCEYLTFNLENESILNNKENSVDFIIKNGILEEDKTHFRTDYLCLMCFNHLRKEELKGINVHTTDINLDNIDVTFDNLSDRNIIKVLALDFNNGNDFKNSFISDDIWREQQKNEDTDNIRYIYLFTKEMNSFKEEYYTFRGLFRFLKRVNDVKYWKKCKVSENRKVSIKKEDIERYIKIEEDLNDYYL